MPRPISATISRSALSHNLGTIRARLDSVRGAADPVRVWAVIKANAYGHGIERAVQGFARADGLAMLDLAEAVRCREAGWSRPILLLEGVFEPVDLEVAGRYGLTLTVHHADQLAMLEAARPARPFDVFLKFNTGMNRLGFTPADGAGAHARLRALQEAGAVAQLGTMTHFSTADTDEGIAAQLAVFRRATAGMSGPASLCNSAACLRYPEVAGDWARPGIALYGASPFGGESAAQWRLRPAMALRSRLIGTQALQPGDAVGYGGVYRAQRHMRVGVVACGYADGYPRHAPTGTPVVVAGVRTRLLGRVSMDMLAVDLEPVPQARDGAPVTLWGADGLSVDDVAAASGTIGYELLCAVAPRVPVYFED
ncbi:Alanine racemase, catabolic [Pigmentiphaga humi]|uniref:Alanine racemase n=1 Tax=Pigmentiphaga humi TaxID=2478468 RepID=A0A3P4B8I7_9BURK|nr:alanine racemase [Pigmentiphaga humi]VCU72018.1 Alanine racemase, catabolic [Pigmentiphaga humi]